MKNMKKSKLIKKVAACLMVVVSIFAMCACKTTSDNSTGTTQNQAELTITDMIGRSVQLSREAIKELYV